MGGEVPLGVHVTDELVVGVLGELVATCNRSGAVALHELGIHADVETGTPAVHLPLIDGLTIQVIDEPIHDGGRTAAKFLDGPLAA